LHAKTTGEGQHVVVALERVSPGLVGSHAHGEVVRTKANVLMSRETYAVIHPGNRADY
jgi:hypothetical protein